MNAHRNTLCASVAATLAMTIILVTSTVSEVRGEDASSWLQAAIDEYETALDTIDRHERESQFQRAETLFRQATEQGNLESADLYANLGNAAFQAKRLGPAITAYRQALQISPNHRRARTNLLHVRRSLPEWCRFEETDDLFDSLFFWNGLYSPSTIAIWAANAFFLAALLYAASIYFDRNIFRNFACLPFVLWIVLMASWLSSRYGSDKSQAVVTANEITARSADSVASAPRFPDPVPGGTEAFILERRDNWTQIQLANEQTAWVPTSSLQFLD